MPRGALGKVHIGPALQTGAHEGDTLYRVIHIVHSQNFHMSVAHLQTFLRAAKTGMNGWWLVKNPGSRTQHTF